MHDTLFSFSLTEAIILLETERSRVTPSHLLHTLVTIPLHVPDVDTQTCNFT